MSKFSAHAVDEEQRERRQNGLVGGGGKPEQEFSESTGIPQARETKIATRAPGQASRLVILTDETLRFAQDWHRSTSEHLQMNLTQSCGSLVEDSDNGSRGKKQMRSVKNGPTTPFADTNRETGRSAGLTEAEGQNLKETASFPSFKP